MTDPTIRTSIPELVHLGQRIKAYRIAKAITQAEIAELCGVSRSQIIALEKGNNALLSTFISVIKGLGIAENLDLLIPDTSVQPVLNEQRASTAKPRQRVSTKKRSGKTSFKWGDET